MFLVTALELAGCRPDVGGLVKRTGHPLEPVYAGMLRRCYNPKEPLYPRYGGRGIKVCNRWLLRNGIGFSNFVSDVGMRPDGMQIDRINNDGDYEPSNCRWADRITQARNKGNCNWVFYKGTRMLLRDLAKMVGKDRRTIAWRLNKGQSVEQAISSDSRHDNEYHRSRKARKAGS